MTCPRRIRRCDSVAKCSVMVGSMLQCQFQVRMWVRVRDRDRWKVKCWARMRVRERLKGIVEYYFLENSFDKYSAIQTAMLCPPRQ